MLYLALLLFDTFYCLRFWSVTKENIKAEVNNITKFLLCLSSNIQNTLQTLIKLHNTLVRYQSISAAIKKSADKGCMKIGFWLKAWVENALKHESMKHELFLYHITQQQNIRPKAYKQPKEMLPFWLWNWY